MKHYIYKYVNKDSEIIYIGKSDAKVTNRLNQHGKHGDNLPSEAWDEINNSKIYRFECVDSVMSDYYESEMIRRHKPKWNRSKTKDWKGFPFLQEPEWELYLKEEKKKTNTPFKNYLLPPFNSEKLSSIKNLFVELYNRKEQISLQYLWLESNIKKLPTEGSYYISGKEVSQYRLDNTLSFPNNIFYGNATCSKRTTIVERCQYGYENGSRFVNMNFTSNWKEHLIYIELYINALGNQLCNIENIINTYYPEAFSKRTKHRFYYIYDRYKETM